MKYFTFSAGKARIMGILNVTPDSFFDGGRYAAADAAIARALEIEREGAAFLDIGAQSTRPGATVVSPEEEWSRLQPVLLGLQGKLHISISIDTFYPTVAEQALKLGARVINDVSGTASPAMAQVIVRNGAGWILMHNSGGAHAQAQYADVIKEVRGKLETLAHQAIEMGVRKESVCLDPGIGFGKSREDDLRLLANIARVKPQGFAFLVGASRKRVIAYAAGEACEAGSNAAHVIAQWGGADIIRTHDVASAGQAANFTENIMRFRIDKSCEFM